MIFSEVATFRTTNSGFLSISDLKGLALVADSNGSLIDNSAILRRAYGEGDLAREAIVGCSYPYIVQPTFQNIDNKLMTGGDG